MIPQSRRTSSLLVEPDVRVCRTRLPQRLRLALARPRVEYAIERVSSF